MKLSGACHGVMTMLMLLLAGCSTPTPRPTLISLPSTGSVVAKVDASVGAGMGASGGTSTATKPLLKVRRVAIPEYIETRRMRYRADASTLEEWPNTYWAERIEIGVAREFVSALRAKLPSFTVCDLNCGDAVAQMTLQIDLAPLDFERSSHTLNARARVTMSSPSSVSMPSEPVPKVREFAYRVTASADSPQAHAQSISDVLDRLASDVAAMLPERRD